LGYIARFCIYATIKLLALISLIVFGVALPLPVISPKLTLTVDKTVAGPGETIVLSGSLDIPKECGDVYKDNVIDGRDISIVSKAFGSWPGRPNWNPDADLNKDGVVDGKDLTIVCRLYGQTSGNKTIYLYASNDGVTWNLLAQVTTSGTSPIGAFSCGDTIPRDAPSGSFRYYKAYFQGGGYWLSASSGVVRVEVGYTAVGVYWDADCTNRVTSIDWGTLYPGQTASKLIYIRNEGNVSMTLSLATENWNPPEAANYISLSWNYDGRTLRPGDVIPVTLYLSVSPNIPSTITSFSFDIIISGYEIGG
jgi:hypothetical protein